MSEDLSKVMERIKKMLALAENEAASPGEAANAARMAQKLMHKYNLDHTDLIQEDLKRGGSITSDFPPDEEGYTKGRLPWWRNIVSVAVGKLFDCLVVQSWLPRKGQGKPRLNVRFLGYKADVEVCRWTYHFLVDRVEAMAEDYWNDVKALPELFPDAKSTKESYRTGAAREIVEKIERMIQEREKEVAGSATGTALVVAKRQAIEDRFGAVSYDETNKALGNHLAANQGRADAKNLNILTPIEQEEGEDQKRLT